MYADFLYIAEVKLLYDCSMSYHCDDCIMYTHNILVKPGKKNQILFTIKDL